MDTGKVVIINDVQDDPILFTEREVLDLIDVKSIMAFPVSFKDTLIGTLVLRTARREKNFNDREIRFCELISHLAASPLKNAYIFDTLHKEKELAKGSLREKETLLQEIYHRTKNNMQVICSLLSLQAKNVKDEQVLTILQETQNRIKSMALVHTKLYQSKDLSMINLKSYIEDLTSHLFKAYHIDTNKILLKRCTDDILVSIDSAVPCGLIINEIIVNTLKYAFPDDRKGEITIGLHSTDKGEVELRIADNGIGLPKEFDVKQSKSLGLQIVYGLAEDQLSGKIELNRENGLEFLITFKEQDFKKRV
jgi:two-component sensor histidine kinase